MTLISAVLLVSFLFIFGPLLISASDGPEIPAFDDTREIPIHLEFDPEGLIISRMGEGLSIEKEGMSTTFEEGEPMVPMDIFSYVIDPYAHLVDIEITGSVSQLMEVPGEIASVPNHYPISLPADGSGSGTQREIGSPVELLADGYIRGFHIQDIRFTPLIPEGKATVRCFTEVHVTISYRVPQVPGTTVDPISRPTSVFGGYLRSKVRNPEDIPRFMARPLAGNDPILDPDDVQYVIITDTDHVGEHLKELADWKTRKGVPARIVELSFIKENYTGRDTQEKIRNFIKDAVSVWETEFVLLGGDVSVVPYRSTYVAANGYESTDCAADLYYSDLDSSFNADNDTIWGEVTDNVDLRPDVFVGRATAETPAEMRIFVSKTLKYEIEPLSGYLDNVTLAGEYLDSTTNSSVGLDLIKNNILTPNVNSTSLFDDAKGDFGNLNRPIFMGQVDNGLSYLFHAGHCNWNVMSVGTGGNGNLYNSNVGAYKGGYKTGVMNSVGCITTRFSQNDCIAELHVMEADGGSVAYIGNSRYGWYSYGAPGWGPSEKLQYRMAYELYNQGNTRMGEHFALAKDFYTSSSHNYNSMRWIQMALNLMGDPEPHVRTADPREFNITLPENIGRSYPDFSVTVRDMNGSPVRGALVCLDQEDFYDYNTTDPSGRAYFDFMTGSFQKVNVTVSAYNHIPFSGNISVDLTPPSVIVNSISPATTGDVCTINCTVIDMAGVEQVEIEHRPASLSSHHSATASPIRHDSNYTVDIEVPWNSTDDILYRILAKDRPGNWNITNWTSIEVLDDDEPVFLADMTERSVTTGDRVVFNISVADNIGVSNVTLSYFINGVRAPSALKMQRCSEEIWTGVMEAPMRTTGELVYIVNAADGEGNENSSLSGTIAILDDDRPIFLRDLTVAEGSTSDPLTFRIEIKDNIEVTEAFVEYRRSGDIATSNITMTGSGDTWEQVIDVPSDDLREYHYFFSARDAEGNWNISKVGRTTIIDDDAPELVRDWSPSDLTTGDATIFKVQIRDNIKVRSVNIDISTHPDGSKEMKKGSRENWSIPIDIPSSSLEDVTYSILAVDIYGNILETPVRTLRVFDNDPPVFSEPNITETVEAGSELMIDITVEDNIGMKRVEMEWWIGGHEDTVSLFMKRGDQGSWSASILVPLDSFGTLYFRLHAVDINGNPSSSDRFDSSIIEYVPETPDDDDEPRSPVPGADDDGDLMEDLWEFEHGLDIGIDDSGLDPDGDGFSNLEEFLSGTDPMDGASSPGKTVKDEDGDTSLLLISVTILAVLAVALAVTALMVSGKRDGVDHDVEMVLDDEEADHQHKGHPVSERDHHKDHDHHVRRSRDFK
ncbi:MAG: C25 family cysteine peptidase [Thermoplasmatota archaeon]